jgi:DNA-binding NarL/FixJ family response regulator
MKWNSGMRRVYLAAELPGERAALRALLVSLGMEIVGESTGWGTVLTLAQGKHPDAIVVSWGLIARRPAAALRELRASCPNTVVIVAPRGERRPSQAGLDQASAEADNLEGSEGPGFSRQLANRMQVILARVEPL